MAYSGTFKPKNTAKYVGNSSNIVYRSLKERQVMKFFDETPDIIQWSSEEIVIPYKFDLDGKMHRYFVDFFAEIKTRSGQTKKLLIEYKPKVQTKPPQKAKVNSRKRTARYVNESMTYVKNMNKWDAAKAFADNNGMEFVVIHEDHIKSMVFFETIINS